MCKKIPNFKNPILTCNKPDRLHYYKDVGRIQSLPLIFCKSANNRYSQKYEITYLDIKVIIR